MLKDKEGSVFRSIDWWTILIFFALLTFGWISVCGASYNFGETDIFSMDTRSGAQIKWIALSLVLGTVILLLSDRLYETLAVPIYILLLVVLFGTIFNPHEIKGSRSWLVLGPLHVQPAEFAKFATALCLARFMSKYGYNINKLKDFLITMAIVLLPMGFIVLQKETGSALVYCAFFLMLYREGMTGSVLFVGVAAVIYFVIGLRFAEVMMWHIPTSVGMFSVLMLTQLFSCTLLSVYSRDWRLGIKWGAACVGITLLAVLFAYYVIPFDVVVVQLSLCAVLIGVTVWHAIAKRIAKLWIIALFTLGSMSTPYAANYAMAHVFGDHQKDRINVLLGLKEDLRGAGYNVHQSQIAIGSGGLEGKGFLNGTQTKLQFVPEQETDFIFCTVGEEEGFLGAAGVLLLFLALILRLIHLAERQPYRFGRVYGYCVLSIFLFHVFINIGMVLGLTPVIGIPLPFFSYGGSSLWGFTLLLFIFLRIDAGRNLVRK